MTENLIVFLYGVYLGGFMGTLARQAQVELTAAEVPGWPSLIIQPTLWPLFFLGTVFWAAFDVYANR